MSLSTPAKSLKMKAQLSSTNDEGRVLSPNNKSAIKDIQTIISNKPMSRQDTQQPKLEAEDDTGKIV